MSNHVKLTLSADRRIVQKAKRLAKQRHTSVSAMFARFVEAAEEAPDPAVSYSPRTLEATGLVKLPEGKTDRELLEEALFERFGLK